MTEVDRLNTTIGHFIDWGWKPGQPDKTFFAATPATGEMLAENNRKDAIASRLAAIVEKVVLGLSNFPAPTHCVE